MWFHPRHVAALLALVSLTLACTPKEQQPTEPAGPKLSAEQQKALDDYRQEIEVGRNMAGRLLGYYGIIEDEKVLGYVNQVGNYVASYSDAPERRYMFAILKHESVNAFACPGGYILITMGAVRHANNEAELARILGHEVAHVGKRHMYDALKKMKEKELEDAAKSKVVGGPMHDALVPRERPEPDTSTTGSRLAEYLTGKGGVGLNVLAAAQAGMNLMTGKGLDKSVEFEADQEGVRYAIRAGYEPKALLTYLKRLEDHSDKKVKNLEKTHPPMADRRKHIAELLKTMKAEDIIGASGEERFTKVKKAFPKFERE